MLDSTCRAFGLLLSWGLTFNKDNNKNKICLLADPLSCGLAATMHTHNYDKLSAVCGIMLVFEDCLSLMCLSKPPLHCKLGKKEQRHFGTALTGRQ